VFVVFKWGSFSGKAKDSVVKSNEVATKKGSKSKISLPDGTQVWLNADTRLTYSNDFMGEQREVFLTGEAFFDVAHNEKRPFIIHANRIDIKVLGTAFNVRNYPQDEFVETSLIRGKIEVNFQDRPDEKITLHPNEKLTINNRGIAPALKKNHPSVEAAARVTIKTLTPLIKDSSVAEIAWMNDELVFTNDTMEQIALELERRYNIAIAFEDEAVKQYRYSAVFGPERIDKILDVISLSKKFNYTIDGRKVTISK
jgi:ferric-dicitrate binding protein FerR (iron transport regulator)